MKQSLKVIRAFTHFLAHDSWCLTVRAVSGLLAKTTLDVVGVAALGYNLDALSTSCSLAESYEKIFECVTALQVLISVIHQYIPIRNFLPLKVNRDYVRANREVRRILREHIRLRKKEYRDGKIHGEKASRDLLTLMIEESQDIWSEDEMLGFVSVYLHATCLRVYCSTNRVHIS